MKKHQSKKIKHPNEIAQLHLADCNFEIQGYWDEDDRYYESIQFTTRPETKLISRSLGMTSESTSGWLQLKYDLTIADTNIGELCLILNDELEVVDENWVIDLKSSDVIVKLE